MESLRKSKKIAFISGTLPPTICGVGMYSYRLLDELGKNKNLEIHLITGKIKNIPKINNIKIHEFNNQWDKDSFKEIINIIKKINPDIINFQFPTLLYQYKFNTQYLIKNIKRNFPNIPLILTLHELSQAHIIAKIRNLLLLQYFKYIIFTNINDLEYARKIKLLKNKNVVNIPIFPNNYYQQKIIKGNYFCFIGTLDNKKGMEYLLNAVNILKSEGLNIKLKILTEIKHNNQYHTYVKKLINKYNLKNNITLYKKLSSESISMEIARSFAIILPYNLGVSPRNGTFLEAISYKKPVITTKGRYTDKEMFINNKNCILITPKDSKLLSVKMKTLLNNKKLYDKLGNNAYKIFQNKNNIHNIAKKYIKYYISCI